MQMAMRSAAVWQGLVRHRCDECIDVGTLERAAVALVTDQIDSAHAKCRRACFAMSG
jgi:hypothetical protein